MKFVLNNSIDILILILVMALFTYFFEPITTSFLIGVAIVHIISIIIDEFALQKNQEKSIAFGDNTNPWAKDEDAKQKDSDEVEE